MLGCFYAALIAWGCTAIKPAHRRTDTDLTPYSEVGEAYQNSICNSIFCLTLYAMDAKFNQQSFQRGKYSGSHDFTVPVSNQICVGT